MNNAIPPTDKARVVILGSGYGGASCAKVIQEKLGEEVDLIVIDRRKANVHKIGAARAAVCGDSYSPRVLIPNDSLVQPGKGRMVRGAIRQVTHAEVIMDDGVRINYDYLVCATGAINFSICEPPLRFSERDSMKKFFSKVHKKIRSAERILIIGGGAVGVELAGEIKYEYNSKVVTIVHSGTRLLSTLRPYPGKSFDKKIRARLDELDIGVLTGQKILINWKEHGNKPYISSGGIEYVTDKGRKVNADLVLLCAGKKLNNQLYPQDWLDDTTGQVKVRRSLQLLEHDNIFCVGDLNDIPDNKQAVFAVKQGEIAAENINKLVRNKRKMKKYSPGFGWKKTFIFVGVGRKKGVGYMGWFTLGSSWMRRIKTTDLFTKQYWKLYGIENQVPAEVGGPSQGNKLGTVARPPNLMATDGMSYNIATRSMENRGSQMGMINDPNRIQSMGSVTSLSDMYGDDNNNKAMGSSTKSTLLEQDPNAITRTGPSQADERNDLVSFVGSLDGRKGDTSNSILKPLSPEEYKDNRSATLQKSKKNAAPSNSNFAQVPLPGKPNRSDVISFVGSATGNGQ